MRRRLLVAIVLPLLCLAAVSSSSVVRFVDQKSVPTGITAFRSSDVRLRRSIIRMPSHLRYLHGSHAQRADPQQQSYRSAPSDKFYDRLMATLRGENRPHPVLQQRLGFNVFNFWRVRNGVKIIQWTVFFSLSKIIILCFYLLLHLRAKRNTRVHLGTSIFIIIYIYL